MTVVRALRRPDGTPSDSFALAESDLLDAGAWAERTSELVLSVRTEGARSQLTVVRRGDLACAMHFGAGEAPPGWITTGGVGGDDQPVETQDLVIWYPAKAFVPVERILDAMRVYIATHERDPRLEWCELRMGDLRFEELWE
ncbi:MAG: hypothetical protein U0230_13075 [Polyangiales bacterium]